MRQVYELRSSPLYTERRSYINAYPTIFHRQVELFYILDGELPLVVDGIPHVLSKGELSVAFPYIMHSSSAAQLDYCLLIFDPEICSGLYRSLTTMKPKHPYLRLNSLRLPVQDIFLHILEKSEQNSPYSQAVAGAYITALMGEIMEQVPMRQVQSSDLNTVQLIIHYCLNHYREELTLAEMSKALGISKSHISWIFSEKLHSTLRSHVHLLRIEEACRMLRETTASITEIYMECGFSNQGTFNRLFLQHCGMTPQEYRSREAAHSSLLRIKDATVKYFPDINAPM